MVKKDLDLCPICGEYMEVRCTGHRDRPFIDGRKYPAICFICFSVPKTWEIKTENGEITVDGPYFDRHHLYTAKELVEDGVVDDIRRAQKSIKCLIKRIKSK